MDPTRIRRQNDAEFFVSVALLRTSPEGLHAGVAYRSIGKPLNLLHLAFHDHLAHHSYRREYLCFVPPIGRNAQMAIAGFCRRVQSSLRNRTIPYALRYRAEEGFDPVTGDYIMAPDGTGLNCATFVIHLFRSALHPLIDLATLGPRPTTEERERDETRQRQLVQMLRDHDCGEQADTVESEIGCPRIRPEEVAGACLETILPAPYQQCIANGLIALARLDGYSAGTASGSSVVSGTAASALPNS